MVDAYTLTKRSGPGKPARVLRVFGSASRALRYLDAIQRQLEREEPHDWKFTRTTVAVEDQTTHSGQELGALVLTKDGKPGSMFVVERWTVDRGPVARTFNQAAPRLEEKVNHASSAAKSREY